MGIKSDMGLEWVREHHGQLARTGVLRQVLQTVWQQLLLPPPQRLEEEGLARELYLQLAEDESSFAEIACIYGADQPQRQAGQWGPKPLSELPPRLAGLTRTTPVGQLRGPERIGPADWVVLRVEAFTGSRVDDPAVQRRLLRLEGEAWLGERIEAWLKGSGAG